MIKAHDIRNKENEKTGMIWNAAQKLSEFFRDVFCSKERVEDVFQPVYGMNTADEADKYRKKLRKKYAFVCAATAAAAVISAAVSFIGADDINKIMRPEPGEASVLFPVNVSGEYGGETAGGHFDINVETRSLSDEEIEKELEKCEKALGDIFKNNSGSGEKDAHLTSSVKLPQEYGNIGISIKWESSDPVLVSEKGDVDVIALAGKSETVTLTAEMSYDGHFRTAEYDVTVSDDKNMYSDSVKARIDSFIADINEDRSSGEVKLPSQLDGGINLRWQKKSRTKTAAVLAAGAAALFIIYSGRYRRAEKRVKRYKENVAAAFPAVIDKLILLLNSGSTVFGALMRISEDCERECERDNAADIELYREAAQIGRRVRNTNSNIITEWKDFAARMESSDMLRFCTIIADNMSVGSDLSDKLEKESESLREMNRKAIRKSARMLDERMIIPMMLMLFSLILITVAPALLSF